MPRPAVRAIRPVLVRVCTPSAGGAERERMRGIGNVRAYPRSSHGMMSTLPAEEASTRAFRRRRGAPRTDSTREDRRFFSATARRSQAFGLGKGTHSGCLFSRDCDVVGTSERRVRDFRDHRARDSPRFTAQDFTVFVSVFHSYGPKISLRFHSYSPKVHSVAVKPWLSRVLSLAAAHTIPIRYSYP